VFDVITSGAGGVFISGIPVGQIKNNQTDILYNNGKLVDFYKDFSQLKYVKIVSYSKENTSLDRLSKEDSKKQNKKIEEKEQQLEVLKILIEQKKIADETRIKISAENTILKNKTIKLEKEIVIKNKIIGENKTNIDQLEFLELNLLYSHRCRKTFYNNLYKVGTQEYKDCIFKGGDKKN
jgi:rod shape-determining protein MreC